MEAGRSTDTHGLPFLRVSIICFAGDRTGKSDLKQSGWSLLFLREEVAIPIAVHEGKNARYLTLSGPFQASERLTPLLSIPPPGKVLICSIPLALEAVAFGPAQSPIIERGKGV